jgi:hypothetical protein
MRREVATGNLTQAEADEKLRPYCVGWYKSIQNLQKKIAEAEGGSAEKNKAKLRLQQTLQESAELAEAALAQSRLMIEIFTETPRDAVPPPEFALPTEPSRDAYLRIIGMVMDMPHWPKHPQNDQIMKHIKARLHPDKPDLLDYISKDEKQMLSQVFNASSDIVVAAEKEWQANKDQFTKAEFYQDWERIKMELQQGYLPKSSKTNVLAMRSMLLDADAMINSTSADE